MHDALVVSGRKILAIGAEGDVGWWVALQKHFTAREQIPQAHAIGARRHEAGAIRSERAGSDSTRMLKQRPDLLSRGHIPDARTTSDEVQHFVGTLLGHGAVAFQTAKRTARSTVADSAMLPTHAVQARGGKRVLKRIRFSCRE